MYGFLFHLRKGEWVWVDGPSLPARANARLSDRGSRHGNLYSFQKPNETGSDPGVFIRSLMLTFRRKSMKNWWSLLIKAKSLKWQIAPYRRKEQAGDFTGESQWFLASPTCTGTLILARIYVEFDVDQGERCPKIWISSSSTPVNTWGSPRHPERVGSSVMRILGADLSKGQPLPLSLSPHLPSL